MTETLTGSDPQLRSVPAPRRTVLHVMPDLQIGGGQTIALQGIRHLDPARFRTVVAYLDASGDEMVAAFEQAGAEVVCVGHRQGRGPRTVARLRRLIRDERVDLVQTHSDVDRKYGQLAALVARVPVVGHLHAEWMHLGSKAEAGDGLPRRISARLKASVRDAVERRTVVHYVAESARVKELFSKVVTAPISVLQQALPLDDYQRAVEGDSRASVRAQLGVPADATLLIDVSRLVPDKGQEDLFPLLATLGGHTPAVHLALVGDGPLRADLETAAAQHGVVDRVVFAGNRDDVAGVLVAADIFVFPSYSEGFGMVALEAMGAGLPVVAYDLPAFHEFMVPGTTALLCPTGDVAALTEAVTVLVGDPARRAEMGSTARRTAAERFPADGVGRVFTEVYDTVNNTATGEH